MIPCFRRWLGPVALLSLLVSCRTPPASPALPPNIAAPPPLSPLLRELSGLTVSRRQPDLYWAHNDSGSKPLLHAIDAQGRLLGTVRLQGATAVDWEDIASFTLGGEPWLAIADVGDNFAQRETCMLYFLHEPDAAALDPQQEHVVPVVVQQRFRYPDGPRDCEAVVVDARRREVLLITKRLQPTVLYRLTLPLGRIEAPAVELAERVATVAALPGPNLRQWLTPRPDGRLRDWITGADLSADGHSLVLLTYGEPWLFRRKGEDRWADVVALPPRRLPPHGLPQAEAIAISADGQSLLVGSEGEGLPLVRYDLAAMLSDSPPAPE